MLYLLLIVFQIQAYSQLNEFEITKIEPRGAIPVFRDYPEYAAIIIYSSLPDLYFTSNLGLINMTYYDNESKYILIVRLDRQIIKVQLPNYMESSIKIPKLNQRDVLYYTVEKNESLEIKGRGNFTLNTNPKGAKIAINGIPGFEEYSPYEFKDFIAQTYKLRLEKYLYKPVEYTMVVENGKTKSHTIFLEPISRNIRTQMERNVEEKVIAITNIRGTDLNNQIKDEVQKQLFSEIDATNKFTVIDKNTENLEQTYISILSSECNEIKCATNVGYSLGADFVIYGTISKIRDNSFRMSFYLVEIYFDRVVASVNKTCSCSEMQLIDIVPKEILEGLNLDIKESFISINSDPQDAMIAIDNKQISELPFDKFQLEPGNHEILISKSGFENSKFSLEINNRESLQRSIVLQPKRRSKSVNRSTLFPGLGQIYSSDDEHIGRKIVGISFFTTECIFAALTVSKLVQYLDDNNAYNDAYDTYKHQINVSEIEYYKQIADMKYNVLSETQKKLITYLAISGGVWAINIFESYLNFPDYSLESNRLSTNNQNPMIGISVAISF